MQEILINDFLNEDYKEYAREVVFKRQIPSLIDGFKDSGRKIFYYLKSNKNKFIKVSAIAGGIIERCDYHHSETSAQNTIINMGKFFEGSNNLPIALPEGHFGSKIKSGSASARYIFASYNNLMDFIFLDDNLTTEKNDESPEPEHYFPIIPMNIVTGASGIAIGYAVNILPHNPIEVIDMMIDILNNKKKLNSIQPYFWGCDYEYKKVSELAFEISPKIIKFQGDKIIIDELKPDMDREKFIQVLIDLQDAGEIKSFKDETKEQFKFIIKNIKLTHENVVDKLQLSCKLTQNLNLIDDNDTIVSFNCIEDYIREFTNRRLTLYPKRKAYMKHHFEKLKLLNECLCCLIDNKNELTKDKNHIIEFFDKKGISKTNLSICMSKPISTLNENSKTRLIEEIKEYDKQIDYYENTDETKLFLKDLKLLKKEIVKFYKKYDVEI